MKKRLVGSIILVVIIGVIIYGFVSAPKVIRLDRQYEITAYKVNDDGYAQPVTVSLTGVFDEKTESYLGKLIINGKEYTNCRLSPEFALVQCGAEGRMNILGRVFANADFTQWTLALPRSTYDFSNRIENEWYTLLNEGDSTEDIIISLPVSNRDSALEQYDRLMKEWGDKLSGALK